MKNKMSDQKSVDNEPKDIVKDAPFPLTDIDKWVLSQNDEDFHLHNWDDLKEIIATNKLETLKRRPSDLRRYMAWTHDTKAQYGSITNYIVQHKLPWASPPFAYNSSVPFEDASDFKTLVNDWPYGLSSDITHIVVWSKTPIPTDPETGDVTDDSRRIIREFVGKTFVKRLSGDENRVVWFKNWAQLQSVRALEHIHVLVRYATKEDLESWTGQKL
ncbi:N-acetylglucosamine-induced 1 [Hyphodiscus hymeniophilus]|uniref:N-acetylglucosamine-induced 1 n=1 Tax=Hyphodiscus hymeniophilus TaxID=353542 RepID=A0A9P6VGM6_9HELO|nr:N-acetylglucosamine-induced 1 [Hyphodiscus hymeniophilus]